MIIIDAFNLTYKFPELEEMMSKGQLTAARKGLIEKIKAYLKSKKENLKLVIDGKKKPSDLTAQEKIGGIEIYYSQDFSADFLIKEFVKSSPNPKMLTVVTSDKEIITFVKKFRAKIIKSEDFAKIITQVIAKQTFPPPKLEKEINPKVSKEEVCYWEKIFKK